MMKHILATILILASVTATAQVQKVTELPEGFPFAINADTIYLTHPNILVTRTDTIYQAHIITGYNQQTGEYNIKGSPKGTLQQARDAAVRFASERANDAIGKVIEQFKSDSTMIYRLKQ